MPKLRSVDSSSVLRRTVVRNRRRLMVGTALISVHQVCEASVLVLIGIIVDRAVGTGSIVSIVVWIGVLAALFVVLTTAYRFGARQLMIAIATEGHALRVEVSARILDRRGIRTDLRWGDMLSISTTDADNTSYLLDYVPRVVGALVATAVAAIVLLTIDVPLGSIVVIGTPLVLGLLGMSSRLITERVARQQKLAGASSSTATDLITGLRPLRGIGAEDAAAARYREVSRESLRATLAAARTQGAYAGVAGAVGSLLAVGIALTAGWFALDGRISVGELITVIGLAQFLIEPLGMLALAPGWVAEARASADRIALVMNAGVVHEGGTDPVTGSGLELRDVSAGTLDRVSLVIEPGEFVGVVATRASDSDALVQLLAGRLGRDEYTGTVTVGGSDVESLDLTDLRSALLVEPHATDLFSGTLRSNIGTESADVERVLRASAAADVVDEHGLDLVVSERGASLSGGQRQRIALARALLARPRALVLHDPTTAVDSVTEHAIGRGIAEIRHGSESRCSTVVVTSSPVLLAATGRVVVIDDGRVVADGTHADLGHDSRYRATVLR
ncbi:ABC transporter ATP-binding protein [Actinomycetes bacterium M1A6_2h]